MFYELCLKGLVIPFIGCFINRFSRWFSILNQGIGRGLERFPRCGLVPENRSELKSGHVNRFGPAVSPRTVTTLWQLLSRSLNLSTESSSSGPNQLTLNVGGKMNVHFWKKYREPGLPCRVQSQKWTFIFGLSFPGDLIPLWWLSGRDFALWRFQNQIYGLERYEEIPNSKCMIQKGFYELSLKGWVVIFIGWLINHFPRRFSILNRGICGGLGQFPGPRASAATDGDQLGNRS